jgi:glycogen synthase kinase 3 beta
LVQGEPNLPYICSRCYRAPELIFGATNYTSQIDMWSTGCVFVEMINGEPPFLGDSQIEQLIQIIKVLGTPSKEDVLQMNKSYDMKGYSKFPTVKPTDWKDLLRTKDPLAVDLVAKMLQYSPEKRETPAMALMHEYFDELREKDGEKEKIRSKIVPGFENEFRNSADGGEGSKWGEGRNSLNNNNVSKLGTMTVKRATHRLV